MLRTKLVIIMGAFLLLSSGIVYAMPVGEGDMSSPIQNTSVNSGILQRAPSVVNTSGKTSNTLQQTTVSNPSSSGVSASAVCYRRTISCIGSCGQPTQCVSDGCGGQTCCAATGPCCGKSSCPIGSQCYQPPMPTCRVGMACAQVMPMPICITPTPTPKPCPLRIKGDANCDQLINTSDFDVFKSQLQSVGNNALIDPNPLSSADFNSDKKVSVLDFEIWRNTFLK
ncbi:MAG: dockerin type I domain-containing protein [Candidatus Roizmanbacteria bacterium]|nr:dockerin type I domain-containing protein [Candidatus Roizmanbacteria bacterium]